jgi:hypothetical protein
LVGVNVGTVVLVGGGTGVMVDVAVGLTVGGRAAVAVGGRATRVGWLIRPNKTTPPMANKPITSNPTRNRAISTKSLLSLVMT